MPSPLPASRETPRVPAPDAAFLTLHAGPIGRPELVQSYTVLEDRVLLIGAPHHEILVTFTPAGMCVAQAAPPYESLAGEYQRATWKQLRHFARHGELSPHAYGVVVDGALAKVLTSKLDAYDSCTSYRAANLDATVIEIPSDLAAKFAG